MNFQRILLTYSVCWLVCFSAGAESVTHQGEDVCRQSVPVVFETTSRKSLLADSLQATKKKTPKGKAIIQVFTNFHTGFGTMNDRRGFELDRSYLGYEYNLGHGLAVKGVLDIGKSSDVDDYQRIAYIKNAVLTWKYGKWMLSGGLIPTTQFRTQEKFWGNRYILKSFQDQYHFGSSADLGLSLAYQFADWVSADVIVVNGEGYKKIQIEDGLMYGLGVTLKPLKGITFRVYGSMNEAGKEGKDTYNLAAFVGYKSQSFSIAAEYNRVEHLKYLSDNNLQGVSVYGTAKLSKVISIYARYDQLFSTGKTVPEKEEIKLVGGVEFKIGNYVKLSPNIRYVHPGDIHQKNYCMAYINCYFGI